MASSRGAVAEPDQYQWEKLPDMPTARCYSVGAYHEGKLYCIGQYIEYLIVQDLGGRSKYWSPTAAQRATCKEKHLRGLQLGVGLGLIR